MPLLRAITVSAVLAGCASPGSYFRTKSAGHVACPASEIQISNENWDDYTWTASCRGKTYYCREDSSSLGTVMLVGEQGTGQVACSQAD